MAPDRPGEEGGEQGGFLEHLIEDAVQVHELPDGQIAVQISMPDPRAIQVAGWLDQGGARPDLGTPEERRARREDLFEKLRNIDAQKVVRLAQEYFDTFPKHPGLTDLTLDGAIAGVSFLENLEGYTFDPDRIVYMCRAVQDAVRKMAEIIEGEIVVLEGGYGLGYVAMSALALNEELDNRVRVIGLELNTATLHRAAQVADYYGISLDNPHWLDISRPYNAATVQRLPENIHILVAEHYNQGVFCQEPLAEVLSNLIPQLAEPYIIIPSGLDIYGRVVDAATHATSTEVRRRIARRVLASGDLSPRAIEQDVIDALGLNREIVGPQLLARLNFADVFSDGNWDGKLELDLSGVPAEDGVGIVQLRGVQRFHTDVEGQEALLPYRCYIDNVTGDEDDTSAYYGTSMNWWGHVRDKNRVSSFLNSPGYEPMAGSMTVLHDPAFSPMIRMTEGERFEVSIFGPIGAIGAKINCVSGTEILSPEQVKLDTSTRERDDRLDREALLKRRRRRRKKERYEKNKKRKRGRK